MTEIGSDRVTERDGERGKSSPRESRNSNIGKKKKTEKKNVLSNTNKTLQTHYNSREFPDRRSFLGNVEMWDEKLEEELE